VVMIDLRNSQNDWTKSYAVVPCEKRSLNRKREEQMKRNQLLGRVICEQLQTGRGILALMTDEPLPYVLSAAQEFSEVTKLEGSSLRSNLRLEPVEEPQELWKHLSGWAENQSYVQDIFNEDGGNLKEESMYTPEEEPEGNWSELEIPEHFRQETLEKVDKETRKMVRKAHRGLGHPERSTLLRMMKLGGATPEAIRYAKVWQCPVCLRMARPPKPLEASTAIRPFGFNETVGLDLKYLKDYEKNKFVALSVVCAGTSFHQAVLVRNRDPKHVSEEFLRMWISHYGCPRMVIADQGGEFSSHFVQMCEDFDLDIKLSGAHAPWQNALAERHGSILEEAYNSVVQTLSTTGREEVSLALAASVQAKNAVIQRHGITAEMAVFGRPLRWPEAANKDDDEVPYSALGAQGHVWRATQARTAAKMALISRDANDKLRRVMMRQAGSPPTIMLPGTRVYFFSPHPTKGRHRADPHRWRGPATIIAQEGQGKYFVGWRSRVLLVARSQLRLASAEEAAAFSEAKDDLKDVYKKMDVGEGKTFVDLTREEQPTEAKPRARRLRSLKTQAPRRTIEKLKNEHRKESSQPKL
jgi:hypothetical protein